MDIGVIGVGNMGSALVKGLFNSKKFNNLKIHAYDPDKSKIDDLNNYGVIGEKSLEDLINNSSILILAVKPNIVAKLLDGMKDSLGKKLFITIVLGIPISYYLEKVGQDKKIVRVMPNTPSLVGEGMSVLSYGDNVEKDEKKLAQEIFACVGKVEVLDENIITEVTALNGSSPAYVYILIEAMAEAAVKDGIQRSTAYKMAAQSVLGSAKMVLETGLHPGVLKDQVCSPGGTTIAAVCKLEEQGFRNSIIKAMEACNNRASEINKKFKP